MSEQWETDGVDLCVVCPDCAFTFDSAHTDQDGGYSCPVCAEIRLREALRQIAELPDHGRRFLRRAKAIADPFNVGDQGGHLPMTVRIRDLPEFRRLYESVHALLYQRLEVGWRQRDAISITAWNDLISAHDEIADLHMESSEE